MNEEQLLELLLSYTEEKSVPTRDEFIRQIKINRDYEELRQWDRADMQALSGMEVPRVPVDRIGRNLDTIEGISESTDLTLRVSKRELGDERIAEEILEPLREYVYSNGGFDNTRAECRRSMLIDGLGIRKVGYDNYKDEIWCEEIPAESIGYGRCKSKELTDTRFIWQESMMDWEKAIAINPQKAAELNGLKTKMSDEWEKAKSKQNSGAPGGLDYRFYQGSQTFAYINQIRVYEFYIERTNIGESGEYSTTWWNYVIATGNNKKDAVLLIAQEYPLGHPYVGMMSETKKNGIPMSFVERVIPFQDRINIAWAQKTIWNNKSIKSPFIGEEGSVDITSAVESSEFGKFLFYKKGAKAPTVNQVPQLNLEAIEEGSIARQDMDFAASASEPALRGMSGANDSGIKVSLQQNAAVTPLNKFVRAEQRSELALAKKVLQLIIAHWGNNYEKIMRVIGMEKFLSLMLPKTDALGNVIAQPVQFPLTIDMVNYDIKLENKGVSMLEKQQTFNANMAMKGSGIAFDDEYIIKNAPVKNIDDALVSNQKARTDIIMALMAENQMLKDGLKQKEKQDKQPNGGNQISNAMTGASQSQHGINSMIGGRNGV